VLLRCSRSPSMQIIRGRPSHRRLRAGRRERAVLVWIMARPSSTSRSYWDCYPCSGCRFPP
jgi:hypothetical protein